MLNKYNTSVRYYNVPIFVELYVALFILSVSEALFEMLGRLLFYF